MGHSVNGRNLTAIISGWLILKSLLNLFLGFSLSNFITLAVALALGYLLITAKPYMNYVTAVLVAIPVVTNLWSNITGFHLLYLAEAVVDIICIIALFLNKDIKEFFGQNN